MYVVICLYIRIHIYTYEYYTYTYKYARMYVYMLVMQGVRSGVPFLEVPAKNPFGRLVVWTFGLG